MAAAELTPLFEAIAAIGCAQRDGLAFHTSQFGKKYIAVDLRERTPEEAVQAAISYFKSAVRAEDMIVWRIRPELHDGHEYRPKVDLWKVYFRYHLRDKAKPWHD